MARTPSDLDDFPELPDDAPSIFVRALTSSAYATAFPHPIGDVTPPPFPESWSEVAPGTQTASASDSQSEPASDLERKVKAKEGSKEGYRKGSQGQNDGSTGLPDRVARARRKFSKGKQKGEVVILKEGEDSKEGNRTSPGSSAAPRRASLSASGPKSRGRATETRSPSNQSDVGTQRRKLLKKGARNNPASPPRSPPHSPTRRKKASFLRRAASLAPVPESKDVLTLGSDGGPLGPRSESLPAKLGILGPKAHASNERATSWQQQCLLDAVPSPRSPPTASGTRDRKNNTAKETREKRKKTILPTRPRRPTPATDWMDTSEGWSRAFDLKPVAETEWPQTKATAPTPQSEDRLRRQPQSLSPQPLTPQPLTPQGRASIDSPAVTLRYDDIVPDVSADGTNVRPSAEGEGREGQRRARFDERPPKVDEITIASFERRQPRTAGTHFERFRHKMSNVWSRMFTRSK